MTDEVWRQSNLNWRHKVVNKHTTGLLQLCCLLLPHALSVALADPNRSRQYWDQYDCTATHWV